MELYLNTSLIIQCATVSHVALGKMTEFNLCSSNMTVTETLLLQLSHRR